MVDTRVRLERGRANARVTPRRGRFRIWTPAAATVVRGTEFRAEFDEASVARAEITSGVVALTTDGAAVTVKEGFGLSCARAGRPHHRSACCRRPISVRGRWWCGPCP